MHSKLPKSKAVPNSFITAFVHPCLLLSHVPLALLLSFAHALFRITVTSMPLLSLIHFGQDQKHLLFNTSGREKAWFLVLCPLNKITPKVQHTALANESLSRATAVVQITHWIMFINIMNITVKFFTLALFSLSNKKTSTKTSRHRNRKYIFWKCGYSASAWSSSQWVQLSRFINIS